MRLRFSYFFSRLPSLFSSQYVLNWPIQVQAIESIYITHTIIITKSEVSTFPIVVIFSVAVCLRLLYHHMLSFSYTYSPGQLVFLLFLLLLCSLMMFANNRVRYVPMAILVSLHITLPYHHHYADLSEGI